MEDFLLPIGDERGVECLSPPCLSTNMWHLFTHAQKEIWQLLAVQPAELQRQDMRGSSTVLCFSLLQPPIFASPSLTVHSALCKRQRLEGWVATHTFRKI